MKCPSCQHEQAPADECEKCRIIFEKYYLRQSHLQNEYKEKMARHEKSKVRLKRYGIILFVVTTCLVLAGIGGMRISSKRFEENDSKQNLQVIEKARNATVYIKTPWGSGSGFFVDNKNHIITNRHVVNVSAEERNEMEKKANALRFTINRERLYLQSLDKNLNNDVQADMDLGEDLLSIRQKELEEKERALSEMEDGLMKISNFPSNYYTKVVLMNGDEYSVESCKISGEYDIALLEISGNSPSYLNPNMDFENKIGLKVMTIGNPVGLRYVVTSGIISGYQEYEGRQYIQTDAPINPGNSGGPLIDEDGNVLGINTMILNNTEGIGFAIPVSVVFQQFPFIK